MKEDPDSFSFFLSIVPSQPGLSHFPSFFLKRFYLFSFRGEGREKERERNITVWFPLMGPLMGTWPATQACAVTRNRTRDPWVRRPALNPLSHTNREGGRSD